MAKKTFISYLDDAPPGWPDALGEYPRMPGTAFLKEVVHLSDAINQCRRHFKKTPGGKYTGASMDSLYRLNAAALAAILGHLEAYQRFLFAGMIEATRHIPGFRVDEFCRRLEQATRVSMDMSRALAYRGQRVPIGQLIVDNLSGWHDPERVNQYVRALIPDFNFYGKRECRELRVLWQLRHSVVHTGSWLTAPDSQKVRELAALGDKPILLGERFIEVVAQRIHPIVKSATERVGARFKGRLPLDMDTEERRNVDLLFAVESSRKSWFQR